MVIRKDKKITKVARSRKRPVGSRRPRIARVGTRLLKDKARPIEAAILRTLPRTPGDMAFDDLVDRIAKKVNPLVFPLRRTVSWYTKVIQLDLEKRGLIERVPGVSPLRLRRSK